MRLFRCTIDWLQMEICLVAVGRQQMFREPFNFLTSHVQSVSIAC
jgi:hypothetical protein